MNLEIFPLVSEASPRHTLRLTFRVEGSLDGKAIEWMVSHPPPKVQAGRPMGFSNATTAQNFCLLYNYFP